MSNLQTKRLRLKPIDKNDFPYLKKWNSDPQLMRYQGGVWDQEQQENFLRRAHEHAAHYGFGYYLLINKIDLEPVGFISLKYLTDEEAKQRIPNIGYLLQADSWNQGYATEASQTLLDYAKTSLKFSKIQATSLIENKAGNRVLEKLGFQIIETVTLNVYGRQYEGVTKWQKEL